MKRSRSVIGQEILFTNDMKLNNTKEEFLSNPQNQQRFLVELGKHMNAREIVAIHAEADTDLTIVNAALECSLKSTTVLIGEDTDLLVLLIHYCDFSHKEMCMKSESKNNKGGKIWNIKKLQCMLGKKVCTSLLFYHSFLGCDTTSKIFGKGKLLH